MIEVITMMRHLRTFAAAALVSISLVGATAAATLPASGDEEPSKSRLVAESDSPKFEADDGPVPTAADNALAERITELLTPVDENTRDPDGVPPQLLNGIIGVEGSPAAGYRLSLGKGRASSAVVDSLLTGPAARAADKLAIVQSPTSAAKLVSVWRAVFSKKWSSTANPTYSMDLDQDSQRIVVETGGDVSAADVERLKSIDPDLLVVRSNGTVSRLSRTSDSPPHWGGAEIESSTSGCTSGFTVKGKTTGTYYSVTAGHCGGNGTDWHSGSYFYGETAGRENYPDYDQARLRNSTYYQRIYTDGADNFNLRLVTGANDGSIGQVICLSGAVSKAMCGLTIASLSSTFCDDAGCTTYLGRANKSGVTLARPGDSGGPVYLRNTSEARASVRGIIIAGGSGVVWWERYASLSNHLNVTAVVSP